ncbi:MAG: alkaline phosphatase D family protein [Nocardioidaceae bacterium]
MGVRCHRPHRAAAAARAASGPRVRRRPAVRDRGRRRGEQATARSRTASTHPAAASFVWSADTCGQGWGMNPDLGWMLGYRALHETRPDFFIHCGDTVHADSPTAETVTEPDGQVWRNLVTPEVAKVAESLQELRGRHRCTMLDANVRAMYADVPLLAQWDDHETHDNWHPGQVLTVDRYTERRIDVLAARARGAWQESMPVADRRGHHAGSGFASRAAGLAGPRGVALPPHLDVISADPPLELASVLSDSKRHGVRDVVWVPGDVHHCAAHRYDPARAAVPDLDPSWELVAGPLVAGTFGPNQLDATFGSDVVFAKAGDCPGQSPRGGNRFLRHAEIEPDGRLEVSLRDLGGAVLWRRTIQPSR